MVRSQAGQPGRREPQRPPSTPTVPKGRRHGSRRGDVREALDIGLRKLGDEYPDVARTRFQLGSLLAARRRFVEAEPLLARARAVREKAFGPDHPASRDSVEEPAKLYDA